MTDHFPPLYELQSDDNASLRADLQALRAEVADLRARVVVAPRGWHMMASFVLDADSTVSMCQNSITGKWGWGNSKGWHSDVASTPEEAARLAVRL